MISKETSIKLAFMSFVAAVLVVCIHAPSTPVHGMTKLFESATGYVFSVVFMVACSIAANHLLRRFLPRLSKVIFGGR